MSEPRKCRQCMWQGWMYETRDRDEGQCLRCGHQNELDPADPDVDIDDETCSECGEDLNRRDVCLVGSPGGKELAPLDGACNVPAERVARHLALLATLDTPPPAEDEGEDEDSPPTCGVCCAGDCDEECGFGLCDNDEWCPVLGATIPDWPTPPADCRVLTLALLAAARADLADLATSPMEGSPR